MKVRKVFFRQGDYVLQEEEDVTVGSLNVEYRKRKLGGFVLYAKDVESVTIFVKEVAEPKEER